MDGNFRTVLGELGWELARFLEESAILTGLKRSLRTRRDDGDQVLGFGFGLARGPSE
jgi:hypothetical protein